jgi:predicted RNA-binding protein with PIN domain
VPYLIDGNNLLGSWGGPKGPGDRRSEVVRRVAAFCSARKARAILVFDGEPIHSAASDTQHLGAITLRFPAAGRDADSVIREIIDRTANPKDLIVVSTDKAVYSYARTRGASALSARDWNEQERRARASQAAAHEKPEREDDIEGWLRRFS